MCDQLNKKTRQQFSTHLFSICNTQTIDSCQLHDKFMNTDSNPMSAFISCLSDPAITPDQAMGQCMISLKMYGKCHLKLEKKTRSRCG